MGGVADFVAGTTNDADDAGAMARALRAADLVARMAGCGGLSGSRGDGRRRAWPPRTHTRRPPPRR
eukprot:4748243-Pleurochrysis_carterae.AAC.1